MRKMTFTIALATLLATGATAAVSAATEESKNAENQHMGGNMMMGMMDENMMSEMRQMMKDCRQMMDSMSTQQNAE